MITTEVIKSKHGPTYKIKFSGTVNNVQIHGETLPVHIGIDLVTWSLVYAILRTRIWRSDSTGRKVSMLTRERVENLVLSILEDLDSANDGGVSPKQH